MKTRLASALLACVAVWAVGCGSDAVPADAPTADVVVEGISLEQAQEILDEFADVLPQRVGVSAEFAIDGDVCTFTLKPVDDIEGFAKKLDFLTVDEVDAESMTITASPKE